MTPKEKAIEIHSKFLNCKDFSNSYFVIPIDEDTIQCALIAVDELIKETGKKYWYDVKQEIEDI